LDNRENYTKIINRDIIENKFIESEELYNCESKVKTLKNKE